MSSKIEISRDLADKLASGYTSTRNAAMYVLRALLAAPVVERQLDAWQAQSIAMLDSIDYAAVSQDTFVIKRITVQLRALISAPPELSELQATVARLTTENDRLKEVTNFKDAVACVFDNLKFAAANTCSKEWDDQLEDLAEDVIEYAPEYKKQWLDICKLSAEIERLKGGQGEAVAWGTMQPEFSDNDRTLITDKDAAEVYNRQCYTLTPLFASQPAPVSVVLPLHIEPDGFGELSAYKTGWNACLDKVKELNQ